jgi:hypothetical protein
MQVGEDLPVRRALGATTDQVESTPDCRTHFLQCAVAVELAAEHTFVGSPRKVISRGVIAESFEGPVAEHIVSRPMERVPVAGRHPQVPGIVLLPTMRSASYQRNANGLSESGPSNRMCSGTVVKKSVIGSLCSVLGQALL